MFLYLNDYVYIQTLLSIVLIYSLWLEPSCLLCYTSLRDFSQRLMIQALRLQLRATFVMIHTDC